MPKGGVRLQAVNTYRSMNSPSPRPLRVLALVDGTLGGAEIIARRIAMNLDLRRFQSILCVSRWEPRREREMVLAELHEAGVEFLDLERRSRLELPPWKYFVSFMREREVDILHTHKFGSNAWGALLSPMAQVHAFVAHEHGWSFSGRPIRRLLDRELIARRAGAFVAVSEEDRRRMHKIERIPLDKLRFIPNGVPTPNPPDVDANIRAELGIASDALLIGVVATLWPEKALDVLIRATLQLLPRFPHLKVLLVGGEMETPDGSHSPERRRLSALVHELGLEREILSVGRRTDIPNILDALDVAVLSSDSEGSPLAVMEYMEAGKAVIATRVGGVPDLVEEGKTGLLVEPQDPSGLATAIGELLEDPARAEDMGRAGRARLRGEFSIRHTAQRFEALYEELYAASPRAGNARDSAAD